MAHVYQETAPARSSPRFGSWDAGSLVWNTPAHDRRLLGFADPCLRHVKVFMPGPGMPGPGTLVFFSGHPVSNYKRPVCVFTPSLNAELEGGLPDWPFGLPSDFAAHVPTRYPEKG